MRILVVTGSSGGHIFPATAFLDTLKTKYNQVDTLLVLPRNRLNVKITAAHPYSVNYITMSRLQPALNLKAIHNLFSFFRGSFESLFIFFEFRPDIVIGFGSIASIPIVMLSWFFRVKTCIHEQNVIPGLANRFLAKFADKIAISFAETREYLKDCAYRVVLTGNPLRKGLFRIDKRAALDFFNFDYNKFTILVMGGSQGSERINLAFLEAVAALGKKYKLQIIHLTGSKNYDLLKSRYKDLKLDTDVRLFNFLDSMHYAYSASDLLISRAGALTISEAIFFRLPAILVPYPYAHRHQLDNAKMLRHRGCAVMVDDNELKDGALERTIGSLLCDPQRLSLMRASCNNFINRNASDLLVGEVMVWN